VSRVLVLFALAPVMLLGGVWFCAKCAFQTGMLVAADLLSPTSR
jgi:hypothetical protein